MHYRILPSCVAALCFAAGAAASAQSIALEGAEVVAGGEAAVVRGAVALDLPAGTVVVFELRRPGVTVLGKVALEQTGRQTFSFGPFPGEVEPGLYPVFAVARKADQPEPQQKTWPKDWPDAVEGSFNAVVGDPQAAAAMQKARLDKYSLVLFRYGKWYQQISERIETAIARAAEVERMAQGDAMRRDHFRKTLWESTKNESVIAAELLKPIHHDFLVFKKLEDKYFAPNFGPLHVEIAATDELLNQWFGAFMQEAQAVYEQLAPPGERSGKETPQSATEKRRALEAKLKEKAEGMYRSLGVDTAAAWVMREVPLIDRGSEDKGVYKNVSCRFHMGPLPAGYRFNLFATDPFLRVFIEPDEDPKTKKVPAHLVGFQGSVVVKQFPQPLAPDAFAALLTATNEGLAGGTPLTIPDKTMPDGNRKGYQLSQSQKLAGNAVQPAGDYAGSYYLLFGRDQRTIYIFQAMAQKQHWPKIAPQVEEMWKSFRIRDEDPPQLIQMVPR